MNEHKESEKVIPEWFKQTPSNWNCEHLKRFSLRIQTGTTPPTDTPEYYFDGTIPWYTPSSFNGNLELSSPSKFINVIALTDRALRIFPTGTIFFIGIASIGKIGLITESASCNQQIIGIVSNHRINPRFLAYQLKIYEDIIPYIAPATTLPIFDQVKTGYLRVVQPPLSEQAQIAAFLDSSCAAIDTAVRAKRSQIETLEKLKQSQIHRAITKGLDESVELKDSGLEWTGKIPAHWAIRRIKDISELKSGDGIEAEEITPEGEYPVYGGNGLRGYTTAFTHDGYYVLIGRQGALCGNINYAEGKFWATEHAVVATLQKRFDRFWYGELLRVMNLNQYSNAAAQPGLAVDRIRFLRLPIPPFEEQTRIAEYVKNVISRIETIISNLEKQVDTLIAYRKSLIHECVTGQRRVTEADLKQV